MSNYDFKTLSSRDFEELTRDLLQEEWSTHIESFKEGKDQGVDLRYSSLNDGDTIIQCKHYVVSGFPALKRNLKKKELSKVKLLSPNRYVIVTSVSLSPANKAEIIKLFSPFIKAPSDIIGQTDLNNLLSKYPKIEQNNYKLWLASKAVLDRVLHNAIAVQTNFQIENIRRKLPLYVQTGSLNKARNVLEDCHFIIISGIPGIGKTTLAEILLYRYLEQGYAPIKVTENIKEALDLYNAVQKQIFYYDDFLGQTILHDRLKKNEDSAIINFIESVSKQKNSRFIMTTREYILQSANLIYEKISRSGLESGKYILELSDYSKGEKARILYNHLYFSGLPTDYIKEILDDKFYFKIIGHPNYSPRIIEWMTSMYNIQHAEPEQYTSVFKRTLDQPQKLWEHAYTSQISRGAQILLLSLYSVGTGTPIATLRCRPSAIMGHKKSH